MTKSDYIILGAGASGLLLAYRMSQDRYFDDKTILFVPIEGQGIIDKGCFFPESTYDAFDMVLNYK